ncbi:MAG: GNAT family N-acetyltransferase [Clostridia bacterium]|nr:GNAT family N-acetyltransferase [Clostridia bacterium]MBR4186830.1 GNAT family N-acetyltransferase [Clostridia bacterium]
MSDPILYKGRGTPEMYDDLMDFMNYVFGFNGNEKDFKKLLPKLYKPEYDPCYSNYVVTENGKLKAAIGAFDSDLSVDGEILKSRGIGNVAVHPYSRSKGYMKDCMRLALRDMIEDGVDFSILGGQRQRYQHFGFEHAGQQISVGVDRGNLRRAFENVPLTPLEFRDVNADDADLLDRIHALHAAKPVHTVRPRASFYDIACSWRSSLTAILRDGDFRGYFIGGLGELTLADPEDTVDVVRNYVAQRGDVHLSFPVWETDLLARITRFGGGISFDHCEMFNILNYPHVIAALLRFKAKREELGDGELSLFIRGFAGDVSVRIAVKNNEVSVEEGASDCALALGHLEAISFLCGLWSPHRLALSPAVRSWFPLPLFVDGADHV